MKFERPRAVEGPNSEKSHLVIHKSLPKLFTCLILLSPQSYEVHIIISSTPDSQGRIQEFRGVKCFALRMWLVKNRARV